MKKYVLALAFASSVSLIQSMDPSENRVRKKGSEHYGNPVYGQDQQGHLIVNGWTVYTHTTYGMVLSEEQEEYLKRSLSVTVIPEQDKKYFSPSDLGIQID